MTKNLTAVQRQFLAARDVSVPLVAVRTPDPAATEQSLVPVVVGEDDKPAPVIHWDYVRGVLGLNRGGVALARSMGGPNLLNPVEALVKAEGLPPYAACICQNLGDHTGDAAVRQALFNLRDQFKQNWRTCVWTTHVGVPASLEHDVLLIDEPYPGPTELGNIVRAQYASSKLAVPGDEAVTRAVNALAGLASFDAEQAVALSMRRTGVDLVALQERHRQMVEATKGLSVWRGGETFAQVGGLRAFVSFARRFLAAKRYDVGAVLWLDEIEKCFAGVKGDLTGIAQDYLATVLGYLQDGHVPAIMLMGHPGTGKTLLAKAFAGEAGVPAVRMDLGAMHGSLVGESQHAIRHALKVTTAISQGRPLMIATANAVSVLPPELTNRFKWRYFVDLPTLDEKATIWPLHLAKRGLDAKQPRPDDTDWNGREIEQCCFELTAKLLGQDLRWREAREYGVGDVVLGFDEHGPARRYRSAVIEDVIYSDEPVYWVQLASGHEFKATPYHRVLRTAANSYHPRWQRVDGLEVGDRLPRLLRVWQEDVSKEAGWLAGLLDGEGFYSRLGGVALGQNPGETLGRAQALLDRFGYAYTVRQTDARRECCTLRVAGGFPVVAELLGRIRPERLVAKVDFTDLGRMEARLGFDPVVAVERVGVATIIKMRTSTGTFVVDGYPHHNCETAYQLDCSLVEASQYVVPIAQSSAEAIELRRREATGRYLSASMPGVYGHEPQTEVAVGGRKIRLEDNWIAPATGKAS